MSRLHAFLHVDLMEGNPMDWTARYHQDYTCSPVQIKFIGKIFSPSEKENFVKLEDVSFINYFRILAQKCITPQKMATDYSHAFSSQTTVKPNQNLFPSQEEATEI